MAQTHRAAPAVARAGEATPELRALHGGPAGQGAKGPAAFPAIRAFQRSDALRTRAAGSERTERRDRSERWLLLRHHPNRPGWPSFPP
jgi:hypothetical protein